MKRFIHQSKFMQDTRLSQSKPNLATKFDARLYRLETRIFKASLTEVPQVYCINDQIVIT